MLTLANRMLLAASAFRGRSGLIMTANGSGQETAQDMAACPDGGFVLVGTTNANTAIIIKVGLNGQVAWIRASSSSYGFYGVCVDPSNGDIYVSGSGNASPHGIYVLKYSAAGAIQWQRFVPGPNNDNGSWQSCRLDGAGGLLISCTFFDYSRWCGALVKYNTSGVFQWGRLISNTYDVTLRDMAVDASGNAYVVGDWANGGAYRGIVRKYNSSGTLQSEVQIYTGASGLTALTLDASGNIYVAGCLTPSSQVAFQAKLNSAMVLQWGRTATGNAQAESISLDASGNVLSGAALNFIKRNNAGDLLMQRSLQFNRDGAWETQTVRNIVATTESLFVCGEGYMTPGYYSAGIYLAKFPANGTATGNYAGAALYAESTNVTSSAITPTISATTLTDASGLTDTAGALTDYAAGLSINLYTKS